MIPREPLAPDEDPDEEAAYAFDQERIAEADEKFRVCPTCHGSGSTVNPAIDGNGLTSEDFDEQGPEFREDYFSGVYDIRCPECNGLRVVTRAQERAYAERQQDLHTMRMESGEWGAR